MLRPVIEGGATYLPYCAGPGGEALAVRSAYRIRPTSFSAYFLELDQCRPSDVVIRHVDPLLGPGWLLFSQPVEVLQATSLEDVPAVVRRASLHAEKGGYSAGLLSYESSPAFDPAILVHSPSWPVLAWFGLYDQAPKFFRELAPVYEAVDVSLGSPDMSLAAYHEAFAGVRDALASGRSYQVNLTFRQPFTTAATAAQFFSSRCGIDPPIYAAFINGGDWQVASFSPELLFERDGDAVTTKPMKGTAPAPADKEGWAAAVASLRDDPKSQAENIMIVDMARNDLGAVSETGSVQAPKLLQVERHRGLLQMTSTVTSRSTVPTPELLAHVFPAASITGAPKVATTHLIRDLELSPRHIYCGSIGVMAPGWQRFSVAIRTALFQGDQAEFGIGSGVVWDSDVESEYEECLAKRELLLNPGTPWCLVEALSSHRLEESEYVDLHLDRLSRSARGLGIQIEASSPFLLQADGSCRLEEEGVGDGGKTPLPGHEKLRIALQRDGQISVTTGPSFLPSQIRGTLAARPTASQDPNFRIKANSRAVLQEHLDEHPDFDEVLLFNEKGELTEFCRGNLIVEIGGQFFTPPFENGCLPGIKISELLAEGIVQTKSLIHDDLTRCTRFFLTNSVVGMVEVAFIQDDEARNPPET